MTPPVVVAVAITGSVPRKKANQAVPLLPPEQVDSTRGGLRSGRDAGEDLAGKMRANRVRPEIEIFDL